MAVAGLRKGSDPLSLPEPRSPMVGKGPHKDESGMIVVFGSINMDLVARVPRIARPGETVLSRRADSFFGGKGANQAVAAARIGQAGPSRVAMVGAVGNDPFRAACR